MIDIAKKSKKGVALSLIMVSAIALVVLVIIILIFAGEFSSYSQRQEENLKKDCLKIGAECVSKERCQVLASQVFGSEMTSCNQEFDTFAGSGDVIFCLKEKP